MRDIYNNKLQQIPYLCKELLGCSRLIALLKNEGIFSNHRHKPFCLGFNYILQWNQESSSYRRISTYLVAKKKRMVNERAGIRVA
jgi:hypothetical protein